jgi:hypothetical protein
MRIRTIIISMLLMLVSLQAHEEGISFPIFDNPHQWRIESIEKVVDGDTVKVIIDRGFEETKMVSVRLEGIDTPEMATMAGKVVYFVVDKRLKEAAREADDLYLVMTDKDKYYGRMVGHIFWKNHKTGEVLTLAHYLAHHKLGKPYFGKKKEPFTEEELREIVKRGDALL